jgi:hypothetical protein
VNSLDGMEENVKYGNVPDERQAYSNMYFYEENNSDADKDDRHRMLGKGEKSHSRQLECNCKLRMMLSQRPSQARAECLFTKFHSSSKQSTYDSRFHRLSNVPSTIHAARASTARPPSPDALVDPPTAQGERSRVALAV